MDATSHLTANLDAALALANGFGAPEMQGRARNVCDPEVAMKSVDEAFALVTRVPHGIAERDLPDLAPRFARLYRAFDLMSDDRHDEAAAHINDLLASVNAAPALVRHDGAVWHLHFAAADATVVDRWLAEFATGAAMLLGSADVERLHRCEAERCDLVFLDGSRSGTRRFCSTSCQSRTKVAAFRRRAQMP